MNVRGLAEKLDFDVDDLLELLDIFIDATISDLDELREATERGTANRVAQCAHSIKGAAGNFGFDQIYERATAIEANARRGILEGSVEAGEFIREMLNAVRAALENHRQHALG